MTCCCPGFTGRLTGAATVVSGRCRCHCCCRKVTHGSDLQVPIKAPGRCSYHRARGRQQNMVAAAHSNGEAINATLMLTRDR
jgi:hypothetical protein